MEKTPSYKEKSGFYNGKAWICNIYEHNITIPEPHFADTIEINIYEKGMKGNLYIGGKHIILDSDSAVFIAPKVIHSLQYTNIGGKITAIKLNPAMLKPLFDIEQFLSLHGVNWLDIPIVITETKSLLELASVIKNSTNTGDILIAIIKLFQHLIEATSLENDNTPQISSANKDIYLAMTWTEENFHNKINLDNIAELIGYTKNHFCRKFKSLTGVTYLSYLNNIRISNAKKLLLRGYSVNEVCTKCGFDDTSYFIKLFKKNTGMTPRKYTEARAKEK